MTFYGCGLLWRNTIAKNLHKTYILFYEVSYLIVPYYHISDSKIFLSNQKWLNFLLSPKKSDISYLPAESGANSTYQNMHIFLDLRFMQDRCTDVILHTFNSCWVVHKLPIFLGSPNFLTASNSKLYFWWLVLYFTPRKKIEMSKAQTKTCFRKVSNIKKRDSR